MQDSMLPHWILENTVAVEETYLAPGPRLQVVGHTTELVILPKVAEKWAAFTVRHNLKNKSLSCDMSHYLKQLQPEQLTNIQRWAFASVLGIKPDSYVEIGMTWVESHTSVWFIFADTQLIEFMTFRALRTIKRKAEHLAKRRVAGMPESERVHSISKYKQQRKIQGGLIRQERNPRDRWKSCQKTF